MKSGHSGMRAVISSDASGMGRSSTSNVMTIAKTPSANASKRPLGRDFIISAFTLVYAHRIAVALSQHTSLSSSRNLRAISASEQIRPNLIPSNSRGILILNKYSYLRSNHKSMNGYEGFSAWKTGSSGTNKMLFRATQIKLNFKHGKLYEYYWHFNIGFYVRKNPNCN
jgi:hypothetical protein